MPEGNGVKISTGLKWTIGIGLTLALAFCTYVLGRVDTLGHELLHEIDGVDEEVHHHLEDGHPESVKAQMNLKFDNVQKAVGRTDEKVVELKSDFNKFQGEQRSVNREVLRKLDKINGGGE